MVGRGKDSVGAQKNSRRSLKSLGRGGLSCSAALNGNSVFCIKTSFFTKHSSLCRLALEPQNVVLIQSPTIKKIITKVIIFFIWAGVDSNHRSLATADLQSAPFSLSGTYPYLVVIVSLVSVNNLPLTRLELVTSPLPRECSTSEPQGLDRQIAGNRNRTYNLRFTKPLLYR